MLRRATVLLPLLLLAVACGGDDDDDPAAEAAAGQDDAPTTTTFVADGPGDGATTTSSSPAVRAGADYGRPSSGSTTPTTARPAAAPATTAAPAPTTTAAPATTTTTAPPPSPQAVTLAVQASGFAFSPGSLTAPGGAEATFQASNGDDAPHTFTIADLGVDIPLPQNGASGSATVTLPDGGRFAYVCRIHPSMTGTLTVT